MLKKVKSIIYKFRCYLQRLILCLKEKKSHSKKLHLLRNSLRDLNSQRRFSVQSVLSRIKKLIIILLIIESNLICFNTLNESAPHVEEIGIDALF